MKLKLLRRVTTEECFWLGRDFEKGEEVFEYRDYTYGCITGNGIACCLKEGEDPFFELPLNALERI